MLNIFVVANVSKYQETTITAGGVAQNLFSGVAPVNGYEIINNDIAETLYFREAGTAAVAGASSVPLAPGFTYTTPAGYKPSGAISVIAATTAHAVVARSY